MKFTISLLFVFLFQIAFLISATETSLDQIVTDVRNLFENKKIDRQVLKTLYSNYNSKIEDLDLFIDRAENLFPHLNCGLTTVYLKAVLKKGEIVNGKYKDENHTFLLIENEMNEKIVVDITADQYGGPSVYVGILQAPWKIKN